MEIKKEEVREEEKVMRKGNGVGVDGYLTSLANLLVLSPCCMDRDSAMSVTGLWIFLRSFLYFTYKRERAR